MIFLKIILGAIIFFLPYIIMIQLFRYLERKYELYIDYAIGVLVVTILWVAVLAQVCTIT